MVSEWVYKDSSKVDGVLMKHHQYGLAFKVQG